MNKIISDQEDWDDLLNLIADNTLTPILGKEMFAFRDGDDLRSLESYLVQEILKKNDISSDEYTTESLSEAINYLKGVKQIELIDIVDELKTVARNISLDKPHPFSFPILEEFLKINDLKYFINSTVFNNILEKTISDIRTNHPEAFSCNFSLETSVEDFPILEKLEAPYIFNLFGSLLKTTDVTLSEEDILEWASSFNNKMSNATNIVTALKNNSLIFLGCGFPDWMVRFALRLLANQKLQEWGKRRKIYIINNPGEKRDEEFAFLKNYRVITYEGSTADFVHELSSQWARKNPNTRSIFLSYTRADTEAVLNLKKEIEKLGNITCWYDKDKIEGGDNWRDRIVDGIRKADIFIPLISTNSVEHEDGFVQKEWWDAGNESRRRKLDKKEDKFLVPVVIDGSRSYGEVVQKFFPEIDISKAPEGNPDDKFLANIKSILKLE